MTTPQGPDRYGADRDPEQAGPPTWGTPPPGGWGSADPGPSTGAWDPDRDDRADDDRAYDDRAYDDRVYDEPYDRSYDGGTDGAETDAYVGRRRAEDRDPRDAPAAAPWGDEADSGGTLRTDRRYGDARAEDPGHDDPGYADDPDYGDSGYGDSGYGAERPLGAGRPGGTDPWSDTGETEMWDPERAEGFEPGDEPWAPREAVRTPWRGPGGLSGRALAAAVGGVVVVAALLVALFWVPGWAISRTLDKTALQNGVTQILTQNYKLQVGAVECPDDVTVESGTEFSCQALVDGEQVTVPGKVTSDAGDYQVSRV